MPLVVDVTSVHKMIADMPNRPFKSQGLREYYIGTYLLGKQELREEANLLLMKFVKS